MTISRSSILVTSALLLLPAGQAHAQAYPNRAVRVIVTYAPGGGSDTLARLIGAKASTDTGQQFVVDNRPGSGGVTGTQLIARAVPDGYVIGVIDAALTINPGLIAKLPYDTVKDIAAVTLIATSPLILLAHPSVPAKTQRS